MKCEHCGMNEATFYYRSSVNGRVTEQHLCPQCAHELGLDKSMSSNFWGYDFFESPFRMMESMLGGFPSRMLTEFPAPVDVMDVEPQDSNVIQINDEPASQGLVTDAEQKAFTRECKRNALQHQLDAAVKAENYEEAARIRDELRGLTA